MCCMTEEYDTKTKGQRHTSAARALGEGIYRILRHKEGKKKPHTHLIYKLEFLPEDENNEPQESLNIKHEGSFHIQIKNPAQHGSSTSQFRALQMKRQAVFVCDRSPSVPGSENIHPPSSRGVTELSSFFKRMAGASRPR